MKRIAAAFAACLVSVAAHAHYGELRGYFDAQPPAGHKH